MKKPYAIWFRMLDSNGNILTCGRSAKLYLRKGNAVRAAEKLWSKFETAVSEYDRNPFEKGE